MHRQWSDTEQFTPAAHITVLDEERGHCKVKRLWSLMCTLNTQMPQKSRRESHVDMWDFSKVLQFNFTLDRYTLSPLYREKHSRTSKLFLKHTTCFFTRFCKKVLPTYWKTPKCRSQASWRSQSPQRTVPGSSPCVGYWRTRRRTTSGGNSAPIDRQRSWSRSWMAASAGQDKVGELTKGSGRRREWIVLGRSTVVHKVKQMTRIFGLFLLVR